MKKRFLSGFLALTLCLGMLPATAWAEDTTRLEVYFMNSCPASISPNTEAYGVSAYLAISGLDTVSGATVGARLWRGYKANSSSDYTLQEYLGEATTMTITQDSYEGVARDGYYTADATFSLVSASLYSGDGLLVEYYVKNSPEDLLTAFQGKEENASVYTAAAGNSYYIYAQNSSQYGYATTGVMGTVGHFDMTDAIYPYNYTSYQSSDGEDYVEIRQTPATAFNTIYLYKSDADTLHTFTLTSGTIKSADAIEAVGGTLSGVGAVTDSVTGITTITGTLTFSKDASSLILRPSGGGQPLVSYTVDRAQLDPARAGTEAYIIDSVTKSFRGDDLVLDIFGLNLDSSAAADYVLADDYYDPDTSESRKLERYVGKSLTGSNGHYVLTFGRGNDFDVPLVGPDQDYYGQDQGAYYHEKMNQFIDAALYTKSAGTYTPCTQFTSFTFLAHLNDEDRTLSSWSKDDTEYLKSFGTVYVTLPAPDNSGSSVRVQQDVTTTTSSATVTITNDGYTQTRYQVDGGDFTAWSAGIVKKSAVGKHTKFEAR